MCDQKVGGPRRSYRGGLTVPGAAGNHYRALSNKERWPGMHFEELIHLWHEKQVPVHVTSLAPKSCRLRVNQFVLLLWTMQGVQKKWQRVSFPVAFACSKDGGEFKDSVWCQRLRNTGGCQGVRSIWVKSGRSFISRGPMVSFWKSRISHSTMNKMNNKKRNEDDKRCVSHMKERRNVPGEFKPQHLSTPRAVLFKNGQSAPSWWLY